MSNAEPPMDAAQGLKLALVGLNWLNDPRPLLPRRLYDILATLETTGAISETDRTYFRRSPHALGPFARSCSVRTYLTGDGRREDQLRGFYESDPKPLAAVLYQNMTFHRTRLLTSTGHQVIITRAGTILAKQYAAEFGQLNRDDFIVAWNAQASRSRSGVLQPVREH